MKRNILRSIRFRFTMIIVCVLAFVIAALIFVNSNYLETYIIQTKLRTIQETVELIREYEASDFREEQLLPLERKVRRSNLDVVVLDHVDTLPQVIFASKLNNSSKAGDMIGYFYGRKPVAEEVYRYGEDYVIYKAFDKRLNSFQIDCIGRLSEEVGYVLSTPLESIRETVELSTKVLTMLGIAAILLGGLLMYVVTLSLTRPIRELSELSREMAELNFDVRYRGRTHDEIDVLGDNMNQMSDRLKRTVQDLQAANLQLAKDLEEKEKIDEMRRIFLGNVSHELKTPIALIQGYSEGLKEGITDDPESMAYYCDVIIDEAQKMNTIVKRLLNLDAIENGEIQLIPEVFDLTELAEAVARTGRKLLPEGSESRLILDLEPGMTVYSDPFMVEQVLQNYLSNAWHHVSDPGTVRVSSRRDGDIIRISVFNTGSPIGREDIEHIWEKFYKADKARTRAYGGSGIGLSIVKAIMHTLGGRYGVINRETGVEFWFELTALSPEEAEACRNLMSEPGMGSHDASGSAEQSDPTPSPECGRE